MTILSKEMEISPLYQKRWDKFKNNFEYILKTYLPFYHIQLSMMDGDLCMVPNVLLYGVHGFPLDILWKEGLKKRFGVTDFVEKECMWAKCLPYTETPYYIRFDMSNPNIPNDMNPMNDLLKHIIGSSSIHTERHIIIIENIDHFISKNINRYMFRVLLERFSKNAWFVCSTYHINRLEIPIQSRFYCIRIPLPTEEEVLQIMKYLDNDEDNKITENNFKTRNILKAMILSCNMSEETYWLSSLTFPPLNDYILHTENINIQNTRTVVYKAFQTDVTLSEFAQDIIRICIKRGDCSDTIHDILTEFANYEHMASQSKGTRILLYMEYMLHYAMTVNKVQKKKKHLS